MIHAFKHTEAFMNKCRVIVLALIIALVVPAFTAAQEGNRGVLFQIGAGAGFPIYPSSTEAVFSYLDSMPGVNRLQISLDIAFGYALSQHGYLLARVDGVADRLYDSADYIQMNCYLYSIGYRYYPMVTGLYLEGNAGASRGVLQSSASETSTSDFGFGYGAAIGYDFNTKARGLGLNLEAKYDGLTIENDQVGGLMLTLDLCWK
jgi:hypothetical protein